MKRKLSIIGACFLACALAIPAPAIASEPITLNYVTFVPRMHGISKVLLADLKEIEKKSEGRLKFNYRGGPEAVKVFAQAIAVKKGAVDMCMTSPDFYGKLVKGMGILVLSKTPVYMHRKTGAYDFIDKQYRKIGIKFLIMVPKEQGTMFHFISKPPIQKPSDFKGLSLAGTGIFDAIGPALGMTPVAMKMHEQYTALERGVIDVARGGIDSVVGFKFYEVAKYLIKPGFGSAPASLFMNLKKWNSIPEDLQTLFVDSLYGMARASEAKHNKIIEGAMKKILGSGMNVVEFKGEDAGWFLKTVEEAIYKLESKDAPEISRKVYELTHK